MNIIQHLAPAKHSVRYEPIAPRWLVLHDTAGLMPGCLSWLADNEDAIASVHYLVTRDGTVYQIGRDTWAMWHAGRSLWADRSPGIADTTTGNADMIGIEIEHVAGAAPYTPEQLRALDELVAHLYDRWPFRGTVSHKQIAAPRGRKVDPELDVQDYAIQAVRARLGHEQEEPMPIDLVHDAAAIEAAQKKLIDAGLLSRAHAGGDAVSVGLMMIMLARMLDQVSGPVDLDEYELRLVKKE